MSLVFSVLIQTFISLKVHTDESFEEGSWLLEVFPLFRVPTELVTAGCATLSRVTRQRRLSPVCIGLASQTEGSLTSRTSVVTPSRAFAVALLCSRLGTREERYSGLARNARRTHRWQQWVTSMSSFLGLELGEQGAQSPTHPCKTQRALKNSVVRMNNISVQHLKLNATNP